MIRLVQAADPANPQLMHWVLDEYPKHALELHSKNIGELKERVLENGGAVKEDLEFTGCGGYLKFYTARWTLHLGKSGSKVQRLLKEEQQMGRNTKLRRTDEKDYPTRRNPDNYKPRRVPAAFEIYAVGATSSNIGGKSMELVKSPIDNVVESVFVHVSDLRRSADWYSMVIGLPLLEERLNGGNVYWMQLQEGTGIILDDNSNNAPDTPRVRFMYNTSDIEESYRFLDKQGVQPLYPIERPHPGLAFFMFTDPDGNSLMVTQSDYLSDVVERLDDTKSPILNRIGGIFLNITDMNRAIRFHSETLSLPYHEVGLGQENSIYSLQMKSGTGVLLDDNRFRHGDDYETLFMLITPDVEGSKGFLESNGVQVFTDIERHGEMAFFTVKDPDGNVIMICSES